jgi:hypothetical protein
MNTEEIVEGLMEGARNWSPPEIIPRRAVLPKKGIRASFHPRTKNLANQVFGKWTVIEFAGYKPRFDRAQCRAYWRVRCSCGIVAEVVASSLLSGGNQSCIHCKRTRAYEDTSLPAFNALWLSYRSGAKRRNLPWLLTQEQFRRLVEQPCRYCGSYRGGRHVHVNGNIYNFTGIDRVDNSLGYTIENVVSCCGKCNRFKRGATFEQIEAIYLVMKEFHDRRKEEVG